MATLQGVHLLDDSVDCGGGGKTSLGNLAHKGHSSFSGETSSWKHKRIWYYLRLHQKHKHFVFWLDFHRQVAKAFTPVLDFSNFLQGLALSAVFYLNNSFYLKLLAFWKKNTLLKRYQISGMPERAKQKWSIFRFRVETPAAMPAISWLKF